MEMISKHQSILQDLRYAVNRISETPRTAMGDAPSIIRSN